ncbi:MAG TPA: hypothetical protein VGL22_20180 [Terracidiphilus sp.]
MFLVAGLGMCTPVAQAASCTTQSAMQAQERTALASAARGMLVQVQNGDVNGLKANTLPAVAADFGGIAQSVQNLSPDIKAATITVDTVYDLDASSDAAGAQSTQFFCGSPVVVLNFAGLPPAKYALALVHATGVEKPQQVSLVLAQVSGKWMLAGFFAKPMINAGHDGLWYWVSARKFKQANGKWAAWIYYRMAADLLEPLDNLSSPNLQKLQQETDEVKPTDFPSDKPVTVNSASGAFQVTAVDTTTAFGGLDLDVHYTPDPTQAGQLHDPPTARKQVVGVMTALLATHPELKDAFHGIWVHADQGTASLFALELPMDQIAAGR